MEENIAPAPLIPPGLDVPYFQVKCSLLPVSALWSFLLSSLSIISFLSLFCMWGKGAVKKEVLTLPDTYNIRPKRGQLTVRFPFD